jgi:hypothetical protein
MIGPLVDPDRRRIGQGFSAARGVRNLTAANLRPSTTDLGYRFTLVQNVEGG